MFNIGPIELKLGLWNKDGEVNISIKFQENLRTLDFLCNILYILCRFLILLVES